MQNKLKNYYFLNMANNINMASEARKVEEEFRLSREYDMTKCSDKQIISNTKLSEFFEDHFKDRKIQLQPEVTSPENYPHILPPDDLKVNSDLLEFAKV